MKRRYIILTPLFCVLMMLGNSCDSILEPKPIDVQTNDVVLNEPQDVANVEIGLYSAFRVIAPATVIAGDLTADNLIHQGTFSQYRELGTKRISSANASVATLWTAVYNTVYISNFILERLPSIQGVPAAERNRVMGSAHFLRGYAYFIALYSFGGVPQVITTDIETNRNIPRASTDEILNLIKSDYAAAYDFLPEDIGPAFAGKYTVNAALARLNLYLGNWNDAEQSASAVINSGLYELESDFSNIVDSDFTNEAILEAGYTLADDPGTSTNVGLNNLFRARREIIPSNEVIVALGSSESGDRLTSMTFDLEDLNGSDNGWSVAKYGTADEDNNNVVVFRLAEMYLIRAEARAQLDKVSGDNSAQSDINALRTRAHAPTVTSVSKSQMLRLIEEERRYELAFEGHRWYDLVRTGRASAVMSAYSPNWKDEYELWPIPQGEIQTNPSLVGNQNPGY